MDPVLQMYLDVPVPVTLWNAAVSSISNGIDLGLIQEVLQFISVHDIEKFQISGKSHKKN